tara:strand:+ start:72 stop:272 length:201 start_codon:yes stop_codon:yes gene_type:complete
MLYLMIPAVWANQIQEIILTRDEVTDAMAILKGWSVKAKDRLSHGAQNSDLQGNVARNVYRVSFAS